ncbi:MAG: N-acetylneuraminate synthase family protein [Candidatus Omnitrophota bacterium]
MSDFKIGGRKIGLDQPPFVMMEVGINHEGSIEKAIQLVDAAKEHGADCVKFQCHITEEEMIPTDMKPGKISNERLWDIIKRCELTPKEEVEVQAYCKKKGILFLSTPFSRAAADRLNGMKVAGFKIGSGECNNYPLIEHIAKFQKPIILSTGMNDMESITRSVQIIQAQGCSLMLMHCTSMYPTPYNKVRLAAIHKLKEKFGLEVGLSDHSLGIYTCLGAIALGATAVEKHFTISRDWPGPDIPISINPEELGELVKGGRAIWEARGGAKTILAEEQPVIDFAYATVVTTKPIRKGETFNSENTWVKRPGTGPILAKDLDKVLHKIAVRDLLAHAHIRPEDVLNFEGGPISCEK